MEGILTRLASGEVLVCDGGLGTMLMERGLPPGACPESFNLEQPQVLEDIARQYVDAGADIITANTFGGSPLKLALFGLADRAAEINARAVEVARKAAGGRACVGASLGPSGKLLKPYGDADPEEVYAGYELQARAVIGAGADAILMETMIDLAEAVLAVKAAKAASPAIPVTATMTFDRTPRGFFTIMGVSVEKACAGLAEAGADVIGSNCGNGIEAMVEIAREMRGLSRLPLLIQPNAGLPQSGPGGTLSYPETPAFMAGRVGALLEAGVSIIGGCCGTTPEHIRAFRGAVGEHLRGA